MGRISKTAPASGMLNYGVRLDIQTSKRLDLLAKHTHRKKSDVLRWAIDELLARELPKIQGER